jgi:hypothetical protein
MVEHWIGGPDQDCSPRMQHDVAIGIMNLMSLPAFNWYINNIPKSPQSQDGIYYSVSLMYNVPMAISIYVIFHLRGMRHLQKYNFAYRYEQCKFIPIDEVFGVRNQPIVTYKFRDVLEMLYVTIMGRVSQQLDEPLIEMMPLHANDLSHEETRRIFKSYIDEHHLDIIGNFTTTPRDTQMPG